MISFLISPIRYKTYIFEPNTAQGGLIERFNIDKYKLYNFLKDVEESYNAEVPYHNAKHATDILQAVYYSLNKSKCRFETKVIQVLSEFEWNCPQGFADR